jgi:hypothetical protein
MPGRARRFREQKWLLDIVISIVGLDWDLLRMGMATAPIGFGNTVPECERFGVGYTDLKKLANQAKLVKQYTGKPDDPEPPAPERYAVNFPNGAVKLSAAEWQSVKAKTGKYAELLSKA